MDSSEATCISLFSGAAGLDLGLELARVSARTVVYVEREAYACEVLASRMEAGDLAPAPLWTDVSTFDGRPFRGLVDIVAGGFPCQDISVAGKRAGIKGERSGLWSQFKRIVGEVQPRLVVVENVARLVKEGLEVVLSDLAELGFDAEWGTLRASDVGATHHRNRLFLVAWKALADARRFRVDRLQPERQRRGAGATHPGRAGEALGSAEGFGRRQRRAGSDSEGSSEPSFASNQALADADCERGQVSPPGRDTAKPEPVPDLASPPRPDELELWSRVVAQRPDLEPAVRRVAPIAWTDCDSQVTEWFLFRPLSL